MHERAALPRCPDELLSSDLSGVCLRVWLAVRKVQGQNAVAYARLDTYARMTGKNRAQVSRALSVLEEAGWVERTREGIACRVPEPAPDPPAPVAPESNGSVTEVAVSATLEPVCTVVKTATPVVKTATEVAETATPSESGSESGSESFAAGWLPPARAREPARAGDGEPHPAATSAPVLYVPRGLVLPPPELPPTLGDDPADVIEQATNERPVLLYANTLRKVIVGPDPERRALFAAFVAEWVARYGQRRSRATHMGEAFRADYGTANEPRNGKQRPDPDPRSGAPAGRQQNGHAGRRPRGDTAADPFAAYERIRAATAAARAHVGGVG